MDNIRLWAIRFSCHLIAEEYSRKNLCPDAASFLLFAKVFELAVRMMPPGVEQWVWLNDFLGFGVAVGDAVILPDRIIDHIYE